MSKILYTPPSPTFQFAQPPKRLVTQLASPPQATESQILASLSSSRFSTYRGYAGKSMTRAWAAYAWNSRVTAVLFQIVAHLEVAVRNSVHAALLGAYGANWHYDKGFVGSLPKDQKARVEKSRQELERERRQPMVDLGVFVSSQTLSFWQGIMTRRHEQAVWRAHFLKCFTGAGAGGADCQAVHSEVHRIRGLRNRIAHHEPLLKVSPIEEYHRIIAVIEWSCPPKARWVADHWPMTADFDAPP